MKRVLLFVVCCTAVAVCAVYFTSGSLFSNREPGTPVDSLNGVVVYYNGNVGNVWGRNTAADGYNIGLKYQCVEFAKRYYYEYLHHKMPYDRGHAKDFFRTGLADGVVNSERNLRQYTNGSKSKPQPDDMIVFGGTVFNRYGHIAIISSVSDSEIEIIQQNPGPSAESRVVYPLLFRNKRWTVDNDRVLGWLRKEL